ncbi:MAG TPA: type IV toxin-antitoxin system AbiEi family antitoxin domain-containing protein [Acidimicrobiia bacterium]|nr:type IV toxin-antitoxin system AbiEi family antitoxin domain-containing protein [Acidimicrobiia bacterium]
MSTAEQRNSLNEGRDSRAAAIAGSQYGLLSAAQAVAIGFTPNAIRTRVTRGRWDRMLPGVYRIAGAPTRGRQAALAAALWAGEDSRVSHLTAAVLWNLDGVVTRRVDITVPYECTRRHPAVVVHRTKTLPAVDRDVVHGIPVTTVARTLVDLAGSVDATVLETALDDALRKQLTTCAFVEWRVRELGRTGRAGVAVLRRLLEERGRGAAALESALEGAVWRVLLRSGLPRPVRQHAVTIDGRSFRLDFAWPDAFVAVEADGYAFHAGRRAFVDDRARTARLVAAGWRVVPVTWDEVRKRPDDFVAHVRSALDRASLTGDYRQATGIPQ